jgi:hypothetical protein
MRNKATAVIVMILAGPVCRAQSEFEAQVSGALETTGRRIAGQHELAQTPVQPTYDADSALNKREYIYGRISASAYDSLPPLSEGILLGVKGSKILTHAQDLALTLTTVSDELPADRRHIKVIHTFGTVAKFEFIADPAAPVKYTGLFQGGQGIMRFSYAGPPHLIGNVPGLGLKFLIDGRPSENMVVMNSLGGQGAPTSVFLRTFTNILPEPDTVIMKTIKLLFEKVVRRGEGLHQGEGTLASVKNDGTPVANPIAPYQVFFVPAQDFFAGSRKDFRVDLAGLDPETKIYEIWATAGKGESTEHIGSLVTKSKFTASAYGDQVLFFKHNAEFKK